MKNPFNVLISRGKGLSRVHLKDIPSTWNWYRKLKYRENFVLEIPHGGIGDHLFLSHVPELLVNSNYCKRVYISTKSKYNFPELFELIWTHNPYIAGTSARRGWRNSGLRPEGSNFLDGIVYQFTDKKPDPGSTHPVMYAQERFREYSNESYALIDFNRVSNKHKLNPDAIRQHLEKAIATSTEPINTIYAYQSALFEEVFEYSSLLQTLQKEKLLKIIGREKNLLNYFSRIKHAKKFYSLYSGGALIAAAFNRPTTTYCEFKDTAISFNNHEYVEVPGK